MDGAARGTESLAPMRNAQKVTLLVFAAIVVAGLMVHLFLPGGLPNAVARLAHSRPEEPAREDAPLAADTSRSPQNLDLAAAEKAYDAGDFSAAIERYRVARADSDRAVAERAARGLERAVLGWALVHGAKAPAVLPEDADGDVARRQAAIEAAPSEEAWLALTRFAAGCASARTLPYLVQQTIAAASPGGPVEARLLETLASAGPRAYVLREAMLAQGLFRAEDPVASAVKSKPKTPPPPAIAPPTGKFTPATKEKLARAAALEAEGAREFELSGPDNAQRREHRKIALDRLKQARDIYQDAQEEDDSADLGRHLRAVMEMIAHLHKEMSVGE